MIFMMVIPPILSARTLGIAELGDLKKVGRIGLKILVLTDMFPDEDEPASGVFVYELTKALSHKNEVVVIHPRLWNPLGLLAPFAKKRGAGGSSDGKNKYNRLTNGIEVYRPKLFVLPKGDRLFFRALAFFFASLMLVKRLQRKFSFDLIHAHMACPAGFAAVLLGMVCGKRVIITAHGSDVHTFPQSFFLRQLILFALKRAHKVATVSFALKGLIEKMAPLQKDVSVIRNGVRQDAFFPIDKTKGRERLGLPVSRKAILFAGNLLPVKGVDALLRAFVNVSTSNQADLIIIGKGESAPELKALTKALGIEARVLFTGTVRHDEIPLWLNACDVLCLPSRREGFPTIIVEAFACGRPVVATRVGGVPEAVINDSLGILINSNHPDVLASALNTALAKEWNNQAIAAYGRRFSWRAIAEEYHHLYEEMLGSPL